MSLRTYGLPTPSRQRCLQLNLVLQSVSPPLCVSLATLAAQSAVVGQAQAKPATEQEVWKEKQQAREYIAHP